jgi:GTP-binding protein
MMLRYPHFPIIEVSANHDDRRKILAELVKISRVRYTVISTANLNKAIADYALTKVPTFPKSKICKVQYILQEKVNPTRFIVFVNHLTRLTSAYKKRIENAIRTKYPLHGIPLLFSYRQRSS